MRIFVNNPQVIYPPNYIPPGILAAQIIPPPCPPDPREGNQASQKKSLILIYFFSA